MLLGFAISRGRRKASTTLSVITGVRFVISHFRNGDPGTLCHLLNQEDPCNGFSKRIYEVNGCSQPDCEDITDMSDSRLDRRLQLIVYVDSAGVMRHRVKVKRFNTGGSPSRSRPGRGRSPTRSRHRPWTKPYPQSAVMAVGLWAWTKPYPQSASWAWTKPQSSLSAVGVGVDEALSAVGLGVGVDEALSAVGLGVGVDEALSAVGGVGVDDDVIANCFKTYQTNTFTMATGVDDCWQNEVEVHHVNQGFLRNICTRSQKRLRRLSTCRQYPQKIIVQKVYQYF